MDQHLGGLVKDKAILSLISHLGHKYGWDSFQLKDHWDGDLCSIGFVDNDGKYLVYVSTYRTDKDRFDITLEDPTADDDSYVEIRDLENVDIETLERVFLGHLRIE